MLMLMMLMLKIYDFFSLDVVYGPLFKEDPLWGSKAIFFQILGFLSKFYQNLMLFKQKLCGEASRIENFLTC